MKEVLYCVYETNADLVELELIHSGIHRDIAESVMVKSFTVAGFEKDYMLIDQSTQQLILACMSIESLHKRGECQS